MVSFIQTSGSAEEDSSDDDVGNDDSSDEELEVERQARKAQAAKQRLEADSRAEQQLSMRGGMEEDEFGNEQVQPSLLVGTNRGDDDSALITLPSGTQIRKEGWSLINCHMLSHLQTISFS
jgi:hypothetical protein